MSALFIVLDVLDSNTNYNHWHNTVEKHHTYLSPQILKESHGSSSILLRRSLFEEFPLGNQLLHHVLGVLGGHLGPIFLDLKRTYHLKWSTKRDKQNCKISEWSVDIKWSNNSSSQDSFTTCDVRRQSSCNRIVRIEMFGLVLRASQRVLGSDMHEWMFG